MYENLILETIETVDRLHNERRHHEARKILEHAYKLFPDNGTLRHQLERSYAETDPKLALEMLQEDLDKEPLNPNHYNNISTVYSALGQRDKAVEYSERAIDLSIQADCVHPQYYNNLGLQYQNVGRLHDSITAFEKACDMELAPDILVNLGNAYAFSRFFELAANCYKKAIELDPKNPGNYVNLGYVYYILGRKKEAFELYEHRLNHYEQVKAYLKIYGQDRLWDGKESIKGKDVAIFCEQGMGDSINFVRHLPAFKKKYGCNVILCCAEPLAGLFASLKGVDEIVIKEKIKPDKLFSFDKHFALMSLPHFLEAYELPNKPYVFCDKKVKLSKDFNVGLCWKGNPEHPDDHMRSCTIEEMAKLKMPGVTFYSLQKDCPETFPGLQHPEIKTFEDTAALLNSLDLLITVDSSPMHLAGALGRPAWAMIGYRFDWRWGPDGSNTDWYPSVRLFRQEKCLEWGPVIARIRSELVSESTKAKQVATINHRVKTLSF